MSKNSITRLKRKRLNYFRKSVDASILKKYYMRVHTVKFRETEVPVIQVAIRKLSQSGYILRLLGIGGWWLGIWEERGGWLDSSSSHQQRNILSTSSVTFIYFKVKYSFHHLAPIVNYCRNKHLRLCVTILTRVLCRHLFLIGSHHQLPHRSFRVTESMDTSDPIGPLRTLGGSYTPAASDICCGLGLGKGMC